MHVWMYVCMYVCMSVVCMYVTHTLCRFKFGGVSLFQSKIDMIISTIPVSVWTHVCAALPRMCYDGMGLD